MTSAARNPPSASRTPPGSMAVNMGCRSRAPRAAAARSAGVRISPVTDTTLCGGRPFRTRSSTSATASCPARASNSSSRQTGSRRVNQLVDVTWEISSRRPTAEMPPPTTMTCCPRNSVGGDVIRHVQLPAAEAVPPRVDGPERPGPGAGGIDECLGGPVPAWTCATRSRPAGSSSSRLTEVTLTGLRTVSPSSCS